MTGPRSEKAEESAEESTEEDLAADPHVAGARDSRDGDTYVGRKSSDDDFDAGETGAEKRAED
ncbi:hypothetical protein [Mycolicibacterium confluentis]|uniref:Uncharacterized protein n=1 Tax=Mycolicibacterium confluentis TaxID=28047 RepID=A0A7I7Y2X7_9MYCO|nr:hypothetical protein [Mycolicibacterium confluentis]MCV7318141.1 hypothetical protein [Mycolicibacterium confluentis]ORV31226.1 hypothetical protein AWB99_12515 [Mycolicibacterium confluentis]BBZ36050.1 hypothetical protein MCNF_46550 [Mycolicibacterium confluentis]